MSLQPRRPLDGHDVAARVTSATLKALQVLDEVRQLGLVDEVLHSHRLGVGVLEALRDELAGWIDDERPARDESAPLPARDDDYGADAAT